MHKTLVAKQSVTIKAPAAKVWDALINPNMIKQYLFGTDAVSDWKVGSPITYRGVWQGKSYEDKGTVLDIVPGKVLKTTFWSSLAGLPDAPEHYKKVTYALASEHSGTRLTVTQDNNATEEDRDHSEQNWKMVLGKLKALLEK
jgi:uncharacterized protein YndB with AHSA1/START domain